VRISRDKLNKLAHVVAIPCRNAGVDFLEDRNTIRQEARMRFEHLLLEEMRIIRPPPEDESQRRIIPEGSQEWTSSYRKYYNEEVKKLGL